MSETWIPGATRIDGPAWKQGYLALPRRTLELIEGDIKHSGEGPWQALLDALNHPTRHASWTFSVPKDPIGRTSIRYAQHYPLESVTWHAGVVGDTDTVTELIGNLTLVGIEHTGFAGEPLTAHQLAVTIEISQFLRDHTFAGANPPEMAVNLWEHNWLSATACPSDRVQWDPIIEALKEEDDLSQYEIVFVKEVGKPEVYVWGFPLEHVENATAFRALKDTANDIANKTGGKGWKLVQLPAGHRAFKDIDRTHRPNI